MKEAPAAERAGRGNRRELEDGAHAIAVHHEEPKLAVRGRGADGWPGEKAQEIKV